MRGIEIAGGPHLTPFYMVPNFNLFISCPTPKVQEESDQDSQAHQTIASHNPRVPFRGIALYLLGRFNMKHFLVMHQYISMTRPGIVIAKHRTFLNKVLLFPVLN